MRHDHDSATRQNRDSAPAHQSSPAAGEKVTGLVRVAAVVSAISSLLYGYDTGIISGALLQIKKDFRIGSALQEVIASAILLGAVLGAFAGSRLSERRGRHVTVLILACVFVVGALGAAAAPSPWLLALARVVLGFAVGGATQTVPMYVAELAPARHRGRLVLTFQVGIGAGILIATIVGASAAVSWRVAIGIAAAPALLMFLLMLRLPESPRWLVQHDQRDKARDTLERVRAKGTDIDAEISDIEELRQREEGTKDSDRGWRGLRRPWVRPALLVGCGIAMFTQLSGIEMIIYYAPTILTNNGFSTSAALRVSVSLGATYLVMMVVGLAIVDRIGRRRLTLGMIPGAGAALAVLGILFDTGHSGRSDIPFIIACLIVFMFFNAGGLQLMGWLTGSEIYPLAVRGEGTSIQAMTLWTTNLVISISLLTIINGIGAGPTMWLYAAFNAAAFVFIWWRMPELTGRSLEQIERQLHRGKFRPRDFARLPEASSGEPRPQSEAA
jgi:sugar porter (SP) family MFS transporter